MIDLDDLITQKAEEYTPSVLQHVDRAEYKQNFIQAYKDEIAYVMEREGVRNISELSKNHWRSINILAWPKAMDVLGQLAATKRKEREEKEAREAKKLKAGDSFEIEINQGMRTAEVLGVIGDEAIAEYIMPRGTTALLIVDAYNYTKRANVSYAGVSNKWLQAMLNARSEWTCRPQGSIKKRYDEYNYELRYHSPSIAQRCEMKGIKYEEASS